jgi:hypothetical protein
MAGKIFISYRRDDDPGFAQLLHKSLAEQFPAADLFMDIEGHIKPGDDFVQVIDSQVAATDVLLVVIGPHWSKLLTARADDPDDFVAIEIKSALENNKRVIPVLVGGAAMPPANALPEAIRPLARRNAVGLRPERFNVDCQGLITALREQFAAVAAAEAVHLEEVQRMEELESWNKLGDDVQALRDHLARFPGGETERYALANLDRAVWMAIQNTSDITRLRAYLDEFPEGAYVRQARERIATLDKEVGEERSADISEKDFWVFWFVLLGFIGVFVSVVLMIARGH